jgi:tRNA (guanine-N7-)-methyltransferase
MSTLRPTTQADQHSAEVARHYREHAPRVPVDGLDIFEIYPSTVQIEMEIGFGRGLFLLQRAAAVPAAHMLGLEIKSKLACRLAERVQALSLPRIRVLTGDVRVVLPNVRPDAALTRVFMHFPDPWWKKRHSKRRVISEEVLDQVARLLRPGGEFFMQTDVEERASEAVAQLAEHPAFELSGTGYLDHNPYQAQSNRERRAVEDGVPIYRVLAVRRG